MYNSGMKNSPTFLPLFEKSFKLSLSNIWRNKVLSLATIFVTGTIIFIFNVILAVNFIAEDALTELNKKVDITLYLKESTTYEHSQQLVQEFSEFEGIDSVTYTSKTDALNKLKITHPDISLAFEKYNLGNPLPASINITTKSPEFHQQIAENMSQDKYQIYLSNIITSNESGDNKIISSVSKNLLKLTDFTHQVIFWLIMIFVIGGALIILNALQITIFTRKKEITVMKLVGASNWFIRSPFIIESIIYGLLAVIISFVMLGILSKNIQIQDTNLFSYYKNINFYVIFLVELLATIALSIFSSIVAVHEYIRKLR